MLTFLEKSLIDLVRWLSLNRRRNARILVDLPINYAVNQEARAINLSESGIRIRVQQLLTEGTILFMIIYLPDDELKVMGEVRWSKPDVTGNFENGVEFFFMNNIYKKKIIEFINIHAEQYQNTFLEQN